MVADPTARVAEYYSDKVRRFGASPGGVDWNSAESQRVRFDQLTKLLPLDRSYSLIDFGCGYGALYEYLTERGGGLDYIGVDISDEMLDRARTLRTRPGTTTAFMRADGDVPTADYVIASGVFNVRLDCELAVWEAHVATTLDRLQALSRHGFAFNILTSYSDPPLQRAHLYYADPGRYFDLCKRRYAKNVALLHDYNLYEFTILVKKTP